MQSKKYLLKKAVFPRVSISDASQLTENNQKNPVGFGVDFTERKHSPLKKILIADDDPAIIDVLTLMLEEAGYTVYASANLKTIADIHRTCPDVILLDMLMSGINGNDICKQLKKQPATKYIPVIIISASKNAQEIAIDAGADGFINKPFEMYKLLQKVAEYAQE